MWDEISWVFLVFANLCRKTVISIIESDCLPFMDVIERKKKFVNLGMFLEHGVRKWDGAKIIGFLSVGNKNVWVILILGEFMNMRHVWVHLSF